MIKLLQQQRHTGRDCRYPDTMDVMFTSLPWLWIPAIPAGTTNYAGLGLQPVRQAKLVIFLQGESPCLEFKGMNS